MAGRHRLCAALPPLLVLLSSAWSTAGAAPTWDNPFYTADTSDSYIKDVDESNSVITLYEDVPIGHKIGVLHIVAQPGDTVTVSQAGSTDEVQLSFDGTSNTEKNVYIQSVIDREKTDSINVGISLNGGNTNYLIIQVADVNDNTPIFDGGQGSQISVSVEENDLTSDSLLTLTATDADVGATNTLAYSMNTGGFDTMFELTDVTVGGKPGCELHLLKALDYETRPLYKLTITVTDAPDDRGKTLSSSVVVFVNVEDVGDTPPRWLVPPMAKSVDENTAQGTELFSVLAIDGDTSVNNNVSYSIISQTPEGFVEMTDPKTGAVTLKKDLDREDPDLKDGGFISIVVQAKEDPEGDACTDITCVNGTALITVNDLDDNEPKFEETTFNTMWNEEESGSLNLTIRVTDADMSFDNNYIQLTLEVAPAGVFELTSATGSGEVVAAIRITDASYLDYEDPTRQTIVFTVKAVGNDPAKTDTASVTVKLNDVNDNAPVFVETSYSASVPENVTKGSKVATISATDKDGTEQFGSESIRYSVINNGGQWMDSIQIDNMTGVVTVAKDKAFNYESGDHEITYTILAQDNEGAASNTLSNRVELKITVEDVDDTPPVLTTSSDAEVLENQNGIQITADITAQDVDSDMSLEFDIDWTQSTGTKDNQQVDPSVFKDLFEVKKDGDKKAKLFVVRGKSPDREQVDTVTLMIKVTDVNTVTDTDSDASAIKVKILDENDNAPEFKDMEGREFNVTENIPKTSIIGTPILAVDVDQDNIITYTLTGGDGLVDINPSSGQLFVSGSIDREKVPSIDVTVTATDSGKPTTLDNSTTITITVLDVNDNGPEWIEIPSNVDNLNVTENVDGAFVYTLRANDSDGSDGDYNKITYSLSGTALKNFTVDPNTGDLTVNGKLDREVLADQNYGMTIQVFAGDQCDKDGNCLHKQEGLLRVKVLDDNDCPPVFPTQDGFLIDESETTVADSTLKNLRATDQDEANTPASKLTYSLKETFSNKTGCSDNKDKLFVVSDDEGNNQAVIKAGMDLQGCWGLYWITMQAQDGENPFNNGTEIYQVRINDKNDPPIMISPEDGFSFELPEDTFKGTTIPVPLPNGTALTVKAVDQDDPDTNNAVLSYSLLSTSTPDDAKDLFYVTDSGEVRLKNTLDRESANGFVYHLDVEVHDNGQDQLTDKITIVITVSDVDEFQPEFDKQRYNNDTHFTEEDDAMKDVSDVTARATDQDETDIIFYFLVGGDKDVFELVDPTSATPQLRNLQKLDRETKDRYQLILQTTRENKQPADVSEFDPDDPTQISLTVIVDDINDITPDFGTRRFMGGIASGDPKEGTILRMQCDDPDLNDPTTYTISSDFTVSDPSIANLSSPFKLGDPDTADLMLNFDVDDGMDGYFDFEVTATDTMAHKSTTSVRIFIIIEDDRVKFVFANQYSFVQTQQDAIADILTAAFSVDGNKYVANIETVTECKTGTPPCTDMITHFIDDVQIEPVLADVIISLQFEDGVTDGLVKALGALSLNLTAIGDTTVVPPDDNDTVFQMLLVVVASVLGGILALTCITSCIHTHKLRRQVKALSINAFGSRDSGMQQAGLAVPGSNMFANQGANPIFTMDEKKAIDAESVSSGDSVLIGVEDDPEFANASRSGQKRPAPTPPGLTSGGIGNSVSNSVSKSNPAYEHDDDDLVPSPAVFDENSHHHMPSFDVDDDDDSPPGYSPFSGGGGTTQNPLFGAGGGGSSQNPLFGAEMTTDGDLSGPVDHF